MPLILLKNVIAVFDVMDKKVLDTIIKSLPKVFGNYIPEKRLGAEYIKDDKNVIKFWPYLMRMTYRELGRSKVSMHVLPLSRVGAMEGASGSRVFVTYFSLEHDNVVRFSNPLILKYLIMETGARDKLKEEKEQANFIKPFVEGSSDNFAFPFCHFIDHNISILWANFLYSSKNKNEDNKPVYSEDNLWKAFEKLDLDCSKTEITSLISDRIEKVYKVLLPVHTMNDSLVRASTVLTNEYKWYLRGEKWRHAFSTVWAAGSEKYCSDFGKNWVNPIHVYEQLKTYAGEISMGVVHGDLHCKNIVFVPNDIRVIDYGWTQENWHIAKDYILLESNLRFMIMHPDVPYQDLLLLCKTLDGTPVDPSVFSCEYARFTCKTIRDVRTYAFSILDKSRLHDEYLIPLFLLSLGLLNYTRDFSNLISARLTILCLGELIYQHLHSKHDA